MNPRPEHEHLSAWLDGEMSDAEISELEAELARDPALAAELAQLEAMVQFVRREGPDVAPPGFHHRVMAKIDEEFPESASRWAWLRRPFGIPLEGLVLAAAAAAVLVLLLPDRTVAPEGLPVEGKPLSPAAFEIPSPTVREPTETKPLASKPDPNTIEVIGRATTEPQKPLQNRDEQGGTATGGVATAPTPVPLPETPPIGTLAETDAQKKVLPPVSTPGTSEPEIVPLRYVIASDAPNMKREILSVAARFGVPVGADRKPIHSASMDSSSEEVLVTIPQAQLPEFTNTLRKLGYHVFDVPGNELTGGDTIEIHLTLSQTEAPQQAAPMIEALDEE